MFKCPVLCVAVAHCGEPAKQYKPMAVCIVYIYFKYYLYVYLIVYIPRYIYSASG